jgi:hypothetical protein
MLALTVAGHIHTESQSLDHATPNEVYGGALAGTVSAAPDRSTCPVKPLSASISRDTEVAASPRSPRLELYTQPFFPTPQQKAGTGAKIWRSQPSFDLDPTGFFSPRCAR